MTISYILLHSLLSLLVLGGVAGLLASLAMMVRPIWIMQASSFANRWVSTRRIERLLDQVVKLDRWFYRHHRASGALILAGAAFLVYFFTARFDRAAAIAGLSNAFVAPPVLVGLLLDAMVLSILMGAVFVMIVSLFLLSRPSMLRGFEQEANQWFSLRRALRPFEIPRFGVDDYVLQHVRSAGVLLLFGSLYTLAGLVTSLSWG